MNKIFVLCRKRLESMNIAFNIVKETKGAKYYKCDAVFLLHMHLEDKDVSKRMEEFELSEKCKQGNNLARKELYEVYSGRMLGVCLRYIGDRDMAQDLLHDGFLKIYASFDKFTWRGEGSLRAWMERVMVNTVLQHLRKNDVLNRTQELDGIEGQYEEPDSSDVETIPPKVLMEFIRELPEGYRTVFNLYTFEEKSHKEIAQLLGINEKSSASQLFRAKGVLAKRIKEYIRINI